MRRRLCGFIASVSVVWACTPLAAAQTVYRCGPDGRSYAQQPCDEGKPVRVGDARSEAQRREAEAVAGRDARVARALEHERLTEGPAARGAGKIEGRGGQVAERAKGAPSAATTKRRKSPSNDTGFRAGVPKPAKTKPASANG